MSASAFNAFTTQFNRIAPIPIVIVGCIGNFLNLLVFTRAQLVKNPCSIYFLCSSLANLSVLIFGLVSRFLSDGLGINFMLASIVYCKIRYFMLHCPMVLSSWFNIMAGIDRYCIISRNVERRQLSNLKYARYAAALTTLIVSVLYSHILVLFTVEQLKNGPYCYAASGAYRMFYDFFYVTTFAIVPPIIMAIIGIATINEIHQTRLHIRPSAANNNSNANQLRKRDRQLVQMALAQFIFNILTTTPVAIQKIYSVFTQDQVKSSYQMATENFLAQLMRILVFINSSTSFYIFMATGGGFRYAFGQMILNLVGCFAAKDTWLYRRLQKIITESTVADRTNKNNKTATAINNNQSIKT